MFVNKKEIVIIYKQINVLLRYIMVIANSLLQAFEIATIYKKIKLLLNKCLRMLT